MRQGRAQSGEWHVKIVCSLECHSCPSLLCLFVALSLACTEIFLLQSVNRTPTHTACTDAHSVSATYTAQHDHISSRKHAWLKSAQLRIARIGLSKTVCHPRVMFHSLPHLTLTTSTSSLTPASSIFQSFSPLQSCPLVLDPYVPCDDSRRSGGSTEIPSPTQSAV